MKVIRGACVLVAGLAVMSASAALAQQGMTRPPGEGWFIPDQRHPVWLRRTGTRGDISYYQKAFDGVTEDYRKPWTTAVNCRTYESRNIHPNPLAKPSPWKSIKPDTLGDLWAKVVCGYAGENSK